MSSNQNDLSKIPVERVEFPIQFVDALYQYLDGLNRPFSEKEPFIQSLREGFKVAQYKEYLRLESEKKALAAAQEKEKELARIREENGGEAKVVEMNKNSSSEPVGDDNI